MQRGVGGHVSQQPKPEPIARTRCFCGGLEVGKALLTQRDRQQPQALGLVAAAIAAALLIRQIRLYFGLEPGQRHRAPIQL